MKQLITDASSSTISEPFQIRHIFNEVLDALGATVSLLTTGDGEGFTVHVEVGPTATGPWETVQEIGLLTLADLTARAWYRIRVVATAQTGTISVWAG